MSDTPLRTEIDGRVLVIHMDDGKANALSLDMITALDGALDRAEEQADAVLVVGRPQRFSGGFDLKVMMTGPEGVRSLMTPGAALLVRLLTFPKPVVMADTGHAIAAGALMLLTADMRIGARGDFKIGLNEVTNGMPVPVLAAELARHRLDPRYFVRATSHAELFSPDDAVTAGYLDRVVEADALVDEALAEARRLGELPAYAFAMTKERVRGPVAKLIRDTLDADFDALLGPAA